MVTPHQKELFAARLEEFKPAQRRLWKRLEKKLLAEGGDAVVVPLGWDADVPEIIKYGSFIRGMPVKLVRGAASDCHGNAARRWKRYPGRYVIMTGYALSDDLWRQHTWLWEPAKQRIVDSFNARDIYFGGPLTPEYAQEFFDANA